MNDLIGKTILGRYRVGAFLRRGGMAILSKLGINRLLNSATHD